MNITPKFRASYGLDAAGEKIINVALADRTIMTDGVNVQYLIQENTIQLFDPTRTYTKYFAVMYQNRVWIAQSNVPVGAFNEAYWKPLRTDPKWENISSGSRQLEAGNYITIDSAPRNPIELTLPSNAQDGDTIVVKDIGGQTGYTNIVIKAGLQSIRDRGQNLIQAQMTVPYSEYVFVYVNRLWQLYNGTEGEVVKFVNTQAVAELQASDIVVRKYDRNEPITLTFPKYANNGDIIHFVGMDTINALQPYFNLVLRTFDNTSYIISPGVNEKTLYRSLSGYFVYDAQTTTWMLYDSAPVNRLKTVSTNTNLFPNETVAVVGTNNTTVETIVLTLPHEVEDGDQITIVLGHIRKGQTVKIVPYGTDKILTDMNLLQFPKRSSYPIDSMWPVSTELSFNGSTSYPPTITLAHINMGAPSKHWMVVDNIPMVERVDSTNDSTKARVGVIALATNTQALVDWENNPNTDTAITPETLAKRTSTETRRGISRIATQAEVSRTSDNAAYQDDLIVTPKKLDAKQATETMRGLAEIATQAEANTNTDDLRIVTPKKLDGRRATETMSGVSTIVVQNGAKASIRLSNGTGVFDYNDHSKIVTPKVLNEYKATETQAGTVYLALDSEVIAGVDNPAGVPLCVTPFQLHKKTATETRIGFSEIATQSEVDAGVDDFRFVTPKKLNDRISSETLTGISRYATQSEFDLGNANLISEPSKIKTFFSRTTRTSVDATSGLTQSGNLWTTTAFNIVLPTTTQRGTTRLATQAEVDAGSQNNTIVTPQTLQAKKATEIAEGIVRIATIAETNSGLSQILSVSPYSLKNAIQIEKTWEAQTTVRGTVKMTEGALTFVGNDVSGSTVSLDTYLKTGYAISPYELNKTLANFMPLKAKAVDSDLLDGLDSSQFIRRDIAQTVNGALTLMQPLTNENTSLLKGVVTVGDVYSVNDSLKSRLEIATHSSLTKFVFATERKASDASAHLAIGYKFEADVDAIDIKAIDIKHDGSIQMFNTLDVSGRITAPSTTISGITNSGTYQLSGLNFATKSGSSVTLNNTTNALVVQSTDSSNISSVDPSGSYKFLTEKNYVSVVDQTFVNQNGDTMSGRLTINAPMSSTFTGVTSGNVLGNPTAASIGTWTVEITDPTIYNQLNGYLVPVYVNHPDTGNPILSRYDEVKSSGTLSQFGVDKRTSYQIWTPKPTVTTQNHSASTMWIRNFNVAKDAWDGWARMYTSNVPPTAADIGALSNDGSTFNNLRLRDWLQIGNLKIYADPATRSVKFEWID